MKAINRLLSINSGPVLLGNIRHAEESTHVLNLRGHQDQSGCQNRDVVTVENAARSQARRYTDACPARHPGGEQHGDGLTGKSKMPMIPPQVRPRKSITPTTAECR